MKNLPQVVIIGRANVGKSTLLNRLIEMPKALTSPVAGTTRDINTGQVYWRGINFELVDTGGLDTIISSKKLKKSSPTLNRDFALDIVKKTQTALKKADLILFIVDIQTGILPQDKEIAKILRKTKRPIVLVANKTDSLKFQNKGTDLYKLGFQDIIFVSGLNGLGTGDLLDEVVVQLKKVKKAKKGEQFSFPNAIKLTLLGKPNVGKSSLLNALIGEDKVIVSPIPFTTREAIDTYFNYNDQNFIIVDTAGIRKQAKVNAGLEASAVHKSLQNAKSSDVCLLLIDISEPITVQDNKLSKILLDAKVSIIIVANKWDKIEEKTDKSQDQYRQYIYNYFPYLKWAPIIFVSALTKKNTHRVLDLALEVYNSRKKMIPQEELDEFLKQSVKRHKPTKAKGFKFPSIKEIKQIKIDPPKFAIRIGKFDTLSFAYIRYLENQLREKFELTATPIGIEIRH